MLLTLDIAMIAKDILKHSGCEPLESEMKTFVRPRVENMWRGRKYPGDAWFDAAWLMFVSSTDHNKSQIERRYLEIDDRIVVTWTYHA